MSERVREIKFEHFRGLPNYSFKLKGKSIVVLSGNGKGKSCIVDGVEFLFSGRIGRFHGEGTGSINAEEAIQHVHKKGEAAVELYFTPTNDKIRRQLSSEELEVPSKPSIENYVGEQPPVESFILRRAQILDFISDQDANRYRKYIQLLGLTDIDSIQRAFVEAAQRASDHLSLSRQSLINEFAVFREPGQSAVTLDSIFTQCSDAVRLLGLSLQAWGELDAVLRTLESRRSPEVKIEIDALNKAILSFERQMPTGITDLAASVAEIRNTLTMLKATSEEAAAGGIIREGIQFFHEHKETSVCPLCEKQLDEGYAEVLERLRKRDLALIQLREKEEQLSSQLDQLLTQSQQVLDRVTRDLENKELLSSDEVKPLVDLSTSFVAYVDTIREARREPITGGLQVPRGFAAVIELRARLAVQLTARRKALIPADSAQLETTIALLKKAQVFVPRIMATEEAVRKAEVTSQDATQAKDAFSKAREDAIQRIFDQIADKVLEYYKKLHDAAETYERSECTALSMKATPRAAAGGLRLAIEFLGLTDSCDARAFLSEGHLDSLGFCIYLATVRMFNPPGTLLVLDDVLTSIDKDHRQRFAELLFEQFSDYQIVLTTHDEYWFGILQSMAQARGDQSKWIFKRIAGWTVDGGPESAAFENTWSYIEANLNEDAYRELGGPLRLVLEDFLKRVAARIGLEVRYNFDGRYTSGEFVIAGIHNKIRDQLIIKTPSDEADIRREIGRIFGTGDLINFLSHDNPGRLEVTLGQTVDFVSALKSITKRCQDNQMIRGVAA
jgi:hypothetical protein